MLWKKQRTALNPIVSGHWSSDKCDLTMLPCILGMEVVSKLQQRIVAAHNASNTTFQLTVNNLRRAALRHPEIAFWVKYNRARQGQLKAGDAAPVITLFRALNAEATTLLASSAGKTTVVFAGSLS
jgi:hypothetical protein